MEGKMGEKKKSTEEASLTGQELKWGADEWGVRSILSI